MLGTSVCLNGSYAHEQLKNGLDRLPDGTDHQSVSVIAQLPVIACLHQSLGNTGTGVLRQAFLSIWKTPVHLP